MTFARRRPPMRHTCTSACSCEVLFTIREGDIFKGLLSANESPTCSYNVCVRLQSGERMGRCPPKRAAEWVRASSNGTPSLFFLFFLFSMPRAAKAGEGEGEGGRNRRLFPSPSLFAQLWVLTLTTLSLLPSPAHFAYSRTGRGLFRPLWSSHEMGRLRHRSRLSLKLNIKC